ncbi:DUF1559 family PulG-like putative transporter [Aquisphaera insulae]|uniref:DUF1559 family PulG-like putative transporter n=1 Tax=Aquisphaera insulae TaxID=2712864 RepID=UPI0013EBA4DC|nr:DUF1559 domain-containing protein [Aquisphaera insulae]
MPQVDGPAPLSRRILLRILAAIAGIPLLGRIHPPLAAGGQLAQADPARGQAADVPTLPGEDHPEARARTVHNLKHIAFALHTFAAKNGGRLPAAAICRGGESLLSWRVAILPFLEEFALYERFRLDEPWDSPHNRALLMEMPRVYAPVRHGGTAPHATNYQGLVGPGAMFQGPEGTKITEFIDAARPTLMVVEAAHTFPWTKPEDVPYDAGNPLPKLGGPFDDGFYAALADGAVRFAGRKVAPETIRALVSSGDDELKTADKLSPPL